MFEASQPFLLFDYFRIPYAVVGPDPSAPPGVGELRWCGDGPPRSLFFAERGRGQAGLWRAGETPFHGSVIAERDRGGRELVVLRDRGGSKAGAIRCDEHGNVFLPFDPSEAIDGFWRERYRSQRRARAALAASYYRLRPAIPRGVQIGLRRAARTLQTRAAFPAWPVEPALHDLYELLLGLVARVAREPIPYIAPWPDRFDWTLVLTHDVETRVGYENVGILRDLELERGWRSAWNFVPRRYDVDDALVRSLLLEGFEVGVHGLYHDGRDLERELLHERAPAMRAAGARWHARGFRSPAARRDAEVIPNLGFDHDSSFPDTDPFGPDGGGCCSWLPYQLGDVVELPITLAQDHTLFDILQRPDARAWHEKTEFLRRRGGMALLITHPDYMLDAHRRRLYADYLDTYRDDTTAWRALPREVARWWRARDATNLVLERGRWHAVGPAATEARVRFVAPSDAAPAREVLAGAS